MIDQFISQSTTLTEMSMDTRCHLRRSGMQLIRQHGKTVANGIRCDRWDDYSPWIVWTSFSDRPAIGFLSTTCP